MCCFNFLVQQVFDLDTCTVDLAFIWMVLEFFGSYYMNAMFWNPYFAMNQKSKDFVRQSYNNVKLDDNNHCLNLDFQWYLLRPPVAIPSNPVKTLAPAFITKRVDHGLFYRYKTIGYDFIFQEICSQNLDIIKAKSCYIY